MLNISLADIHNEQLQVKILKQLLIEKNLKTVSKFIKKEVKPIGNIDHNRNNMLKNDNFTNYFEIFLYFYVPSTFKDLQSIYFRLQNYIVAFRMKI